MSEDRILTFCPTQLARLSDPFLEPCARQRHKIAFQHGGDYFNSTRTPLSEALQEGFNYARQAHYRQVLVIDDDVLPPEDIIARLLEADAPVACGRLPLRPESTRLDNVGYVPWIGSWSDSLDGFTTLRELVLDEKTIGRIRVDVPANPFMYDVKTLSNAGIRFRGGHYWDGAFAHDLHRAEIPIYCVPAVVSKHFSPETRKVYWK
jgi:hypothetical protein